MENIHALVEALRVRPTSFPGGVAMRFARIRRPRDDKSPTEVDVITDVRAMLPHHAFRDDTHP